MWRRPCGIEFDWLWVIGWSVFSAITSTGRVAALSTAARGTFRTFLHSRPTGSLSCANLTTEVAQFPVGFGNDKSSAAKSRLRNETFARTSSSIAERSSKSSMVRGSLSEG